MSRWVLVLVVGYALQCLQVLSEAAAELCEVKYSIYVNKNTHLVDA